MVMKWTFQVMPIKLARPGHIIFQFQKCNEVFHPSFRHAFEVMLLIKPCGHKQKSYTYVDTNDCVIVTWTKGIAADGKS